MVLIAAALVCTAGLVDVSVTFLPPLLKATRRRS